MSPTIVAATYTASGAITAAIIAGVVAISVSIISQLVLLFNTNQNAKNVSSQNRNAKQIKSVDIEISFAECLLRDLSDFRALASTAGNLPPDREILKVESNIILRLDNSEENHSDLAREVRRIITNDGAVDRRRYFEPSSAFFTLSQSVLRALRSNAVQTLRR